MTSRPPTAPRAQHWRGRGRGAWWRADEGRVSAFVVTLTVAILVLAGLTLDGGLALAAKVRANGQAEAAARAGAQAIDLETYRATSQVRLVPARAVARAQHYLANVDAAATVRVAGDTVTVTITTSQPTQLLGLIGIGSITVTASGQAQPQRGISGPNLASSAEEASAP